MHTQHESTEHRLSRNKILIINSNDNTQSGHSENGLTFKCDYLESLCSRCKDVCDGMKFKHPHRYRMAKNLFMLYFNPYALGAPASDDLSVFEKKEDNAILPGGGGAPPL